MRNHNDFRGELKVAEVVSRIDDLNEFIKGIEAMGFKLTSKDVKNKMFILLDFIKINSAETVVSRIKHTQDQDLPKLKPCIYKRR
jgi:ribosomal RNA-processing protein 8